LRISSISEGKQRGTAVQGCALMELCVWSREVITAHTSQERFVLANLAVRALCVSAGSLELLDLSLCTGKVSPSAAEQSLALANQKAQFFEAVVDVLKNDYGVSVVKKRSGKSSAKGKSKA